MTSIETPREAPSPEAAPRRAAVEAPPPIADDDLEHLEHRRLRLLLRNKVAMVAAIFLGVVALSALFAPLLAPYDPNKNELHAIFETPGTSCPAETCSAPGMRLLGTDDLGRDNLSRLLFASRISLLAGLGSVGAALLVALPLGLASGYIGGKFDWLMMRVVDIILSIPPLILVFAIAGILGASLRNAIIALGVYFTPLFVRLIRSETQAIRSSQLVEAERAVGARDAYIVLHHVLPNIGSPIVVQASLSVGTAILAEASLSYLGLGVAAPTASWGNMLKGGYDFITTQAWIILIPSIAIALTVLALNLLGDGLRDALGRVRS